MKYKIYILVFLVCVFISAKGQYVCGVAEGYPPFQYKAIEGIAGFDVDVARAIFSNGKLYN